MNDKAWFTVIVGNIGMVYNGDDWKEAGKTYREYVKLSRAGIGRASGEDVTFMDNDRILDAHCGTN